MTSLTTRDLDLFIPQPRTIKAKADVAELLKDLGFIIGFTGSQGYIRLEHPQLIVEFLVPERGKGSDKPYSLPQLGLNAQALRFLEFLSQNTIRSKAGSIMITLPHPANFALHKLLVMRRRPKAERQAKDKEAAIRILNALIDSDQSDTIKSAYQTMPKKWQGIVKKQLTDITENKILEVLEIQETVTGKAVYNLPIEPPKIKERFRRYERAVAKEMQEFDMIRAPAL